MMQAHQIVIRTNAVVVPAPNTESVTPPPNAAPTPWSCDFCISTNTTKNNATVMCTAVKIQINTFIIFLLRLHRCLDDSGKVTGLQACTTNQRAVNIRLTEQFLRVVCLHAATILDPHFSRDIRAEQFTE